MRSSSSGIEGCASAVTASVSAPGIGVRVRPVSHAVGAVTTDLVRSRSCARLRLARFWCVGRGYAVE